MNDHETTVTYRGPFNYRAVCSCGWEAPTSAFLERDADRVAEEHIRRMRAIG